MTKNKIPDSELIVTDSHTGYGGTLREYRYNGKLHRDDGPAEAAYNSDGLFIYERWYQHGELHRDKGPAVAAYNENGPISDECWYQHGKKHRDNGPAEAVYNSDEFLIHERWYQHGKLHHDDGPAMVTYYLDGSVGSEYWYQHDKRHRDDGPAYVRYNEGGSVDRASYYLSGEAPTQEQLDGILIKQLAREDAEDKNLSSDTFTAPDTLSFLEVGLREASVKGEANRDLLQRFLVLHSDTQNPAQSVLFTVQQPELEIEVQLYSKKNKELPPGAPRVLTCYVRTYPQEEKNYDPDFHEYFHSQRNGLTFKKNGRYWSITASINVISTEREGVEASINKALFGTHKAMEGFEEFLSTLTNL